MVPPNSLSRVGSTTPPVQALETETPCRIAKKKKTPPKDMSDANTIIDRVKAAFFTCDPSSMHASLHFTCTAGYNNLEEDAMTGDHGPIG